MVLGVDADDRDADLDAGPEDADPEDRDAIHRGIHELPRRRVIRLKCIYNFLCSMLVFTPFALCFVTLRGVFMRFPELTY
jgi:hypothetical protein